MERIARKSHEQSAQEIFDQFCDQLINSRSFSLYQHPGSVASNAMDGRPRPSDCQKAAWKLVKLQSASVRRFENRPALQRRLTVFQYQQGSPSRRARVKA